MKYVFDGFVMIFLAVDFFNINEFIGILIFIIFLVWWEQMLYSACCKLLNICGSSLEAGVYSVQLYYYKLCYIFLGI